MMDGQMAQPPIAERLQMLGGILELCRQSAMHRAYLVDDLLARILPPLELGQFRYYATDHDYPAAFVTWALADADTASRFESGEPVDGLEAWTSGDILVFVDLVAPNGALRSVRRDLNDNVFAAGTSGISFRPVYGPDGALLRVRRKNFYFGGGSSAEQIKGMR